MNYNDSVIYAFYGQKFPRIISSLQVTARLTNPQRFKILII